MKTKILNFNARWLMAVIAMLTIGVEQMWAGSWSQTFSSTPTWTPSSGTTRSMTVNSATWSVETSDATGSPTNWGAYASAYSSGGLKFGDSKSNYYGTITLSTDYFTSRQVTAVTVNLMINGGVTTTITVTQGATTIGSPSFSTANNWHDFTANTSSGSGGTLTLSITTTQAIFIHSISVTYADNYSVTYDGNGKTSGTVPVDASSPYAPSSTVTVKANTGNLARTGCTFAGWNTAADGSGTSYAATGSATFTISANTTLYAKWTATVTWVVNGTTARTDANIVIPAAGKSVTPPTISSLPCGDKFMGWTTTNIGAVGLDKTTDAAAITALNLFTGSKTVTGNTTFYAVFADYAE